jgi:hypothetical protein
VMSAMTPFRPSAANRWQRARPMPLGRAGHHGGVARLAVALD